MKNEQYHKPVMLDECIDGLNIRPDGVYVDVTFGGGGHSRAILERLGDEGRLYAFDRDSDALANSIDDPRFCLIHENFKHLKSFLRLHGVRRIDGLLADLGISSHQIDAAERGFSTRFDGPLDLRMDRREGATAADLVNNADEKELATIFRLYGELQNASSLAHAIIVARALNPITTTSELCDAVGSLLPRGRENKVLAMLFQALRIEVNGELEALRQMLSQAVEILNPEGRICIMSYHSLEDRLVKNYFRTGNFEGDVQKDFYGNLIAPLVPVTRKPITASEAELQQNNRARSAKLRIATKGNL
ncbi:MAG: 16S rRNA (cytosine(1402)-N(4))-methyltransferase RsmH [Bacteroidales bacterium]|nr:16S rRNA (cytosine(1402)-N(4))-methyltransferase RsmH [Bacteroidales bacterium]